MKRKGKVPGKIQKPYKLRLFPTEEQKIFFAKTFGCVRFIYNHCLSLVRSGVKFSYEELSNKLPDLKKEFLWLAEPIAQSLQQSILNLWDGFQRFWKGQNKFPKFKKKFAKQSFKVPQDFKLDVENNWLRLPKIGAVRCIFPPKIYGMPKSVTISRTKSGRYYASILCEIDEPKPIYQGEIIGIDMGLRSYVTTSNGFAIDAPKFYRQSEKRIANLQRVQSTKVGAKKGETKSKNWLKLQSKINRIYQKLVDQRDNWIHNLTSKLVRENQAAFIEDLSLEAMKQINLAKSVQDAALGEFVRQLEYKGAWYGCFVGKVSRWFPSSKRCSDCGEKNTVLSREQYEWVCVNCLTHHNRDENAATNILNEGFRLYCVALEALHKNSPSLGQVLAN